MSVTAVVRRYYAFVFVQQLNLWTPIYILFLLQRGFSLAETTLLSSVWWATSVALEVPTGILADRWGRKKSLMLGSLLLMSAFLVLYSAHSFLRVAIAYLLWAAAVSLASGTDSALLYDSLCEAGADKSYRQLYGRAVSIGIVASGLGALCGGLIGEINLAYPILIAAGLAGVEIIILASFREPVIKPDGVSMTPPAGRLRKLRTLVGPILAVIIAVNAVVYTGAWVMGVFYQPYLQGVGFSVAQMGVLYLGFKLIGAIGSYISSGVSNVCGHRQLFLVPLGLCMSVLLMAYVGTSWAVIFIACNFFLNGTFRPVINTLINERTVSAHRATVLSIASLVASLVLVPVQPFMGGFADRFGLASGFVLVSCLLGIGVLIAVRAYQMLSRERVAS